MNPCTICDHAERAAIDAALMKGVSLRGLAELYDVSRSALDRHRHAHLADAPEPDPATVALREVAFLRPVSLGGGHVVRSETTGPDGKVRRRQLELDAVNGVVWIEGVGTPLSNVSRMVCDEEDQP